MKSTEFITEGLNKLVGIWRSRNGEQKAYVWQNSVAGYDYTIQIKDFGYNGGDTQEHSDSWEDVQDNLLSRGFREVEMTGR